MIFGFNTDVKVGENVYHVQTEDRGVKRPLIDSVIYHKGQILDRRRTPYVPADVTQHQIKEMVTTQHRELVEAIRSGAFVPGTHGEPAVTGFFDRDALAAAIAQVQREPSTDLAVELLNPDSVHSNGRLLFRLKVPAGAKVQAYLEVNGEAAERGETTADSIGEAELSFLMPEAPQASVVFRAVAGGAMQTVKFQVRQQ